MKKKYVSRLLAGCLTVTMLTPTGALASVPQPVVTQEASQEAGQENETENKEQAEEYAAEGAAEVQTDETEAAENRTAADKSKEQAEPHVYDLIFDKVSFAYPESKRLLIDNLSLQITNLLI